MQTLYNGYGDTCKSNSGKWLYQNGKIHFDKLYIDESITSCGTNKDDYAIDDQALIQSILPLSKNKIMINFDLDLYYEKSLIDVTHEELNVL